MVENEKHKEIQAYTSYLDVVCRQIGKKKCVGPEGENRGVKTPALHMLNQSLIPSTMPGTEPETLSMVLNTSILPKISTHLPQTHTTFLQEIVNLGLLFLFLMYKKCKTEPLPPLTPKYISLRRSYNSMRMFGFYMTFRGQQLVESKFMTSSHCQINRNLYKSSINLGFRVSCL